MLDPHKERAPVPVVSGVKISHSERVLDPPHISKLDLARYYEAVAPRMLRHVKDRPLSLVRWSSEAVDKGGIFLRHAHAWGPSALHRVAIPEKHKVGEYLVVQDTAGLVSLGQMDILEVHTWNSVARDVERPNRVVLDLDPGPGVPWPTVVRAARDVRTVLAALNLRSWLKTTGGKGLHVVVPFLPDADWETCAAFTKKIAQGLERAEPKRFTSSISKSDREGKVFIDYLRNHRTATSVAAFSLRAREGAPVSLPIDWEELDEKTRPDFTVLTALDRMREPDPWADYFRCRQRLHV